MTKLKLLIAASLVATLPGCAALAGAGSIAAAGASVASALKPDPARNIPLGLIPQDFADLRLGMAEPAMRVAIGDPIASTITPEGWVCHTFGPVLREGGKRSKPADYTDQWKVLMVDRGEGNVVAGWADARASADRPNCEGL